MHPTKSSTAYFALSLAVLFWGISYVGTKVALEAFHPLVLAFLRFFIAAVLFIALLAVRGLPRTTLEFHKKVITVAFFLPGLYFIFENFGVKHTTATKASFIAATIPVAVFILSVVCLGEKMTWQRILSLVLSLAGVALLVLHQSESANVFTLSGGDLLMFGAVVTAAAYMVLTRRLCADFDPLLITAFQMIYGALFFLPFFLWYAAAPGWYPVDLRPWMALVTLALLSTVGAFFTYNYALNLAAASTASLFINIVPFVTAFGSWFILGERLSPVQLCGGILVIAAAFLASHRAVQEGATNQEGVRELEGKVAARE